MAAKRKSNVNIKVENNMSVKSITLDSIETMMTNLVMETNIENFFINDKKMAMLERLGNFKAKRIQIEQQQELLAQQREALANGGVASQPLTIEFIDATDKDRVKKIEQQVEEQVLGGKNNA